MIEFLRKYPEVRIVLVAEERRLKLEYGEAHVAIRAGQKPQEPDNVVQPLSQLPVTLYAHKDYVKKFGMLPENGKMAGHQFVITDESASRTPYSDWARENIPQDCVVFRAFQMRSLIDAVHAGAGIGFLTQWFAQSNPDMVEMLPPRQEWDTHLWLVTHVDLHRSAKIQAFLTFIKSKFATFSCIR